MAHVEFSSRIARPTHEIFDLVANVGRNHEWCPGFSPAQQSSAGPIGRNTTFHTIAKGMGNLEIRILNYERPSRLEFIGTTRTAEIEHQFILRPEGPATRVDQRIDVRPKGALRLLAPVMVIMLKRQIQSNTAALKQYLERAT